MLSGRMRLAWPMRSEWVRAEWAQPGRKRSVATIAAPFRWPARLLLVLAGMLLSSEALAVTPNFSIFDPPPADVAPLADAALRQDEGDADVIAARRAVTGKDAAVALAAYERAIARGNVVAMTELADLQNITNDSGLRIDTARAERLYHRAALLGYAPAQRRFAALYENGDGVAQDTARVIAWYGIAAAHGDDISNVKLALHYLGPADNAAKAKVFSYAQRGERANGILSRSLLGYCYENGIGTAKDEARAFHLIFLAAEQGEMNAQYHLVYMYAEGIGIAADRQQARHWYQRAEETVGQVHAGDFLFLPLR